MVDDLTVRGAVPEDCRIIWEWWNDPVTREMMKANDIVPWEDHRAWYGKMIEDRDRVPYVGLVNSQPAGVFRYDLQAIGVYDVSINLNPAFRGKGYATRLLVKSIEYLRGEREVARIFAMLKKVNIPSMKTFAGAGFVYLDEPQRDYPRMANFDGDIEFYCELDF